MNGDCAVRQDDLLFVEQHLGTNSFCADLDGSGLVDSADVAIVWASMGDACSNLTSAPPATGPGALALAAYPNPCRQGTNLRLSGVTPEPMALQVLDVAGRVVRDLSPRAPWTGSSSVFWDGRDSDGRGAPARRRGVFPRPGRVHAGAGGRFVATHINIRDAYSQVFLMMDLLQSKVFQEVNGDFLRSRVLFQFYTDGRAGDSFFAGWFATGVHL